MKRAARVAGLVVGLLAGSVLVSGASERVIVGPGGTPWTEAADSLAFLSLSPDSVYLPDAQPGVNLAAGALARGGGVFAIIPDTSGLLEIPRLLRLIDGDGTTAFDPDSTGLARDAQIYLDLGGTFAIDRVRLYPRLDSEHRELFPQVYDLEHASSPLPLEYFWQFEDLSFSPLDRATRNLPNESTIIDWPGLREVSGQRLARYLRFRAGPDLPWEIAEIEVYGSGTSPAGEYTSIPLPGTGTSVWGSARVDGRLPGDAGVILQTRTGPDEEPQLYYVDVGPFRRQVTRPVWENIEQIEGAGMQGPVLPNPAWSSWETVSSGAILSPGPNRFIQFRLKLLNPGTTVRQLTLEYATRPIAENLLAEIVPQQVEPGVETAFALALEMRTVQAAFRTDTGFRTLEILTGAEIAGVDSVHVDDDPVVFTARPSERGVELDLWRRVYLDGSFVRVFFRGRVYVDATRFDVRLADDRPYPGAEPEQVSQYASEGDADPFTVSAALEVRLSDGDPVPLVGVLRPSTPVLTPNGDGVSEEWTLPFDVYKLTAPAPLHIEIFDLAGRPVRRGTSIVSGGRAVRIWDGTDHRGQRVPPGTYLYRLRLDADAGEAERTGVVHVVY